MKSVTSLKSVQILSTVEATIQRFAHHEHGQIAGATCAAARLLGKKEMMGLLPLTVRSSLLSNVQRKRWDEIEEILCNVDEHVQMAIVAAAVQKKQGMTAAAKARLARKAATRRRERELEEGLMSINPKSSRRNIESLLADTEWSYLKTPTEGDIHGCYSDFRKATSNDALRMQVCVVCGRELMQTEGEDHYIDHIPNLHKHAKPKETHQSHQLWDGMLILREYLHGYEEEPQGWVCHDCHRSLASDKLPKFALTNNLWPGAIPHELAILTLPEQLLISRYYPRCYVVKLFQKKQAVHPEHLQRGLAGNVSLYEMNTDDVAAMVAGQKMPQSATSLVSVLAITYIGSRKLPKEWLKHTFRVRRSVVADALVWLKQNNVLYRDVKIDKELLSSLPLDDIPRELLTTIRHEPDDGVAETERETYVPSHDQECNADAEEDATAFPGENESVAEVIPLQYLGVTDVNTSRLSLNDVMKHALANTAGVTGSGKEGGYAVRFGAPTSIFGRDKNTGKALDVNPIAAAYPVLWPWGINAPEEDRPITVGFGEHIRWCMQFHDRRFRTHHSFPFTAYSILQRRETLKSARLQMKRKDFDREAILLSSLTVLDMETAAKEEEQGLPISNPRVRLLKKHIFASSRRVTGSNQRRASYRGQIWGTSLYLKPPSLWITLNPSDTHDPVAQVFAGEEIDMDDFDRLTGPDRDRRARNIARDPYAAYRFFFFIIQTVLETLFGIKATGGRVYSHPGVLGRLSGYYGVVESQGRGTLHVHMFLWLDNAPNCEELKTLLKSEQFRDRVRTFIKNNIRAHLDGFTEENIRQMPVDREVAYSRPPDPDQNDFEKQVQDDEMRMVRAQQIHSCSRTSCLRFNKHGKLVCKRRAPWPCAPKDDIDEFGNWTPKRSYGFVVEYNPVILTTLHCNHNIKWLGGGDEAAAATWYDTKYETKGQGSTFNLSALMAKAFMYHEEHPPDYDDLLERNRVLLYRCLNLINQEMEVSGPLAMAYIMGDGDTITSHGYAPVFWSALGRYLKEVFPALRSSSIRNTNCDTTSHPSDGESSSASTQTIDSMDGTDNVDNVNIAFNGEGRLVITTQVDDYRYRGSVHESMSFLTFAVDTYEERQSKDTPAENVENDSPPRRGRPRNQRGIYLSTHPRHKTHQRVTRSEGHNILPNVVGPWFPRHDDPDTQDYYYASMLALLKPWRELSELKAANETWEEAYTVFLQGGSQLIHDIVAGVHFYYSCRTAAQKKAANAMFSEPQEGGQGQNTHGDEGRGTQQRDAFHQEDDIEDIQAADIELTEDDLEAFKCTQTSPREKMHAAKAIEVGHSLGLFRAPYVENVDSTGIGLAVGGDIAKLEHWQQEMQGHRKETQEDEMEGDGRDHGGSTMLNDMEVDEGGIQPIEKGTSNEDALPPADPSDLLSKQRQAYDIIDWHLRENLAGRHPPQLLMLIPGEGGVGKSKTVQTITEDFKQLGAHDMLVKGAYTGIAATLIGGKTLHVACGLPIGNRQQGSETAKRQATFWSDKQYFIIDEMSMISRGLLAKISRHLQAAKCVSGVEGDVPFGGVNIIMVGDLHQFPPVVSKQAAPLFYPINLAKDAQDDVLGRQLYEQFKIVVRLNEQVRVTDPVWHDVLQHVRYGKCKEHHLDTIRSLILTDPRCPPTDVSSAPWKNVTLITPRHATRLEWNRWMARAFCARQKQQLVICPALDTIRGRPLTLLEQFALATKPKRNASREERGGLPNTVEIAIGMRVMVTLNVNTDLDVANGSLGEVVKIVLDEREPAYDPHQPEITLKYPPLYVLVKLQGAMGQKLEGLDKGIIPIYPAQKTFTISNDEIGQQTVTRTQLPLTAAYAFTDYRSQGQTIEYSFVDLRTPPSGELTPFSAYVALSRGRGREHIRLLGDFDDRLFTTHPSEYLRVEDRRLDELDMATERWWKVVNA